MSLNKGIDKNRIKVNESDETKKNVQKEFYLSRNDKFWTNHKNKSGFKFKNL